MYGLYLKYSFLRRSFISRQHLILLLHYSIDRLTEAAIHLLFKRTTLSLVLLWISPVGAEDLTAYDDRWQHGVGRERQLARERRAAYRTRLSCRTRSKSSNGRVTCDAQDLDSDLGKWLETAPDTDVLHSDTKTYRCSLCSSAQHSGLFPQWRQREVQLQPTSVI